MNEIKLFSIPNQEKEGCLEIRFIETIDVVDGVTCDVYIHPETNDRDLGVIHIDPGSSTPPQKIIKGEETIEGYLSGKGVLAIRHIDGTISEHKVSSGDEGFCYAVDVGDVMQWRADEDAKLTVFEICFPPYEDGRYDNLSVF